MEQNEKFKRDSAFDSANIFSKIFFGWSLKLLAIGLNRELNLDDFSKVAKSENANFAANKLRSNWETELNLSKKNGKDPNLMKVLMKTFKHEAIILTLMHLFDEIISISQPLMIGVIIRYFSSDNETQTVQLSEARNVSILLCLSLVAYSVVRHQFFFFTIRTQIRVKTAVSILLFEKILKLKRTTTDTSIGQILNVLTNDIACFNEICWILWFIIIAPFELVAVYVILWKYIGYSCSTGLLVILAILAFQCFTAKFFAKFRLATVKLTDSRVKLMSEVINAMKVIKMYSWEKAFSEHIASIRSQEIKQLQNSMFLKVPTFTIAETATKILVFATVLSVLLFGFDLNAEITFVTVALFNVIRYPVTFHVPLGVGYIAETYVACQRIKRILLLEERIFYTNDTVNSNRVGEISFDRFSGRWSKESEPLALSDITARIEPGELVFVVGPVGSGKTCLLMAILNEIELVSGKCMVNGKTSYTPQEAWCFNGSAKQNILFGRESNHKKYEEVVSVCCLSEDFGMFSFGDETLIGEKGITLSGGQKARISLARAVYDEADIYIFDDPLSAVNSEVANSIFHECIENYLKETTRILVTHNLQFLDKADKVIVMKDGCCLAFGSPENLIDSGIDLTSFIKKKNEVSNLSESILADIEVDTKTAECHGNEMSVEEYVESKEEFASTGAVKLKVHIDYFKASRSVVLPIVVILSIIFAQFVSQFIDYWLALWMDYNKPKLTSFNETATVTSMTTFFVWKDQQYNISFYAVLMLSLIIGYVLRFVSNIKICLNASVNLHNRIFHRLLRSPMAFFDRNPKGRILNRFTGDIGQLDQRIPITLLDINATLGTVIGVVIITCVVNPYLIIVCVILIAVSLPLRKYYLRSVRNVKRYEAITRSPVFNCVSTTFDGLTCIRAFKFEDKFEAQFRRHLNDNNACIFLLGGLGRSFGFVLDWCTVIFFVSVTIFLFTGDKYFNGGEVGLMLSSSLMLINEFQFSIRILSEYETQMIATERVLEYTQLPSEAALTIEASQPQPSWPSQGSIIFQNVYLSYSNSSQPTLQNLSFNIESGTKIGIVGRTGAGKSSMITALFRLVEFDGTITIDGIDIKKIALNDLRKKLSIIPQDPIMFQGTIRSNVDPYNEFSNETIWTTLQSLKLDSVFNAIPGNLDSPVSENGSNLSVGQRQLVCMVRALLRNNKILVMDEATASIDHETDALIQTAIKECLHSCTLLTIAHRLNTVIDMDKILVIDGGRIIEFDTPYVLLSKSDGHFKGMVTQLGDNVATNLFSIAKKRYEKLSSL